MSIQKRGRWQERSSRKNYGHLNRIRSHAFFSRLDQVEDDKNKELLAVIASSAAQNAVNENRAMKIPITVAENGWVVRKTPEGNVERISQFQVNELKRQTKLTRGTVLHVKKPH